jgi:hypothetical protein
MLAAPCWVSIPCRFRPRTRHHTFFASHLYTEIHTQTPEPGRPWHPFMKVSIGDVPIGHTVLVPPHRSALKHSLIKKPSGHNDGYHSNRVVRDVVGVETAIAATPLAAGPTSSEP